MRSIVLHSADTKRRTTLAKVLNSVPEFTVTVVATTAATISCITEKKPDILIIDTNFSGETIEELLCWCKEEHPDLWRVLLREEHLTQTYRTLLSHVHGSLPIPANRIGLKRFVEKIAIDYPERIQTIKEQPVRVYKPTLQERVNSILTEFAGSHPPQDLLNSIITGDPELSRLILNRINSPFYGLATRISSPERAILMLGTEGTLTCLAESLMDSPAKVA